LIEKTLRVDPVRSAIVDLLEELSSALEETRRMKAALSQEPSEKPDDLTTIVLSHASC
jgi:hypothetical protein